MQVSELFPTCKDRECPKYKRHTHLLPHQEELLNSGAKYIYLQGGYGAAKTLPACALGVLLSLTIPGNRGVVVRDSYPKLHDSTQRVFMETLARGGIKWRGRENRDGWYHRIILPHNKSEIFFREARNLGRFIGPEYGWFLIDEAFEVQKEVFKKLQGRLRLSAAEGYHRGILLSNPPHHNHWLHEVFGEEPREWEMSVDVGDRMELVKFKYMKVSTRANPHNPPGYLADLLTGLTQAEIARLVEGDYGYVPDGPPVYTTFEHHRHVGIPEIRPHVPLVRSWDFGFRHPAVTFHQFWRCQKTNIHWTHLADFEGRMIEAVPLCEKVIEFTDAAYPGFDKMMIEDVGDVAGAKVSDTGPGPILVLAQPPHNLNFLYKKCEVEPGLRMIRDFLRLPQCPCGESRFLIHRRCRYSIEGYQGGYHLKREIAGKPSKEDPMKDGFYDDYMDASRYAAEHYLRSELIDPKLMEALEKTDPRRMYGGKNRDPWQRAMQKMMQHRGA